MDNTLVKQQSELHLESDCFGDAITIAYPGGIGAVVSLHVDELAALCFQELLNLRSGYAVHVHHRLIAITPFLVGSPHGGGLQRLGQTPECAFRRVGDLEDEYAAGCKQTEEFLDVGLGETRRHVLKRDVGIDKIDGLILEHSQIVGRIEMIQAALSELVILLRQFDHGRADVDAMNYLETSGQGLAQASNAAPEIQCRAESEFKAQMVSVCPNCVDLIHASAKESIHLPPVLGFIGPGQNTPERICFPELIPVFLQFVEFHKRVWAHSA